MKCECGRRMHFDDGGWRCECGRTIPYKSKQAHARKPVKKEEQE